MTSRVTRLIAAALWLACVSATWGDYIADRRAAEALSKAGQRTEALEAFQKLAAASALDEQKSDALAMAVREAVALRQDDLAMRLARQIPLKPQRATAVMQLLERQQQCRQVIDEFGAEDIDAWPDNAKAAGSHVRGQCYFAIKDGKAAAADLERAVQYCSIDNDKALALNSLGDTYRLLLKDGEKARETYVRVFQTKATYKQCHAAIALAEMATLEGNHELAIAELSRVKMAEVDIDPWPAMMHAAWGRTYRAAGRNDQAIASFRAALACQQVPAWVFKQATQALAELGAADAAAVPSQR